MNERIQKLAEQAQILADKFQEQWKAGPSSEEFFHRKFAELIVQECKDLLFESSENNRLPIAVDDMGHIIDTHFGVEE